MFGKGLLKGLGLTGRVIFEKVTEKYLMNNPNYQRGGEAVFDWM